jgi:hypothetical protein
MAYDDNDIFASLYAQDAIYKQEEDERAKKNAGGDAVSQESKRPTIDPDNIFGNIEEIDAYNRALSQPAEERGFAGDVGSHFVRGLNQGAAQVGGMMAEMGVDAGEDIYQWTKKNEEEKKLLRPDVSEVAGDDGLLYRGFMGAVESTPASLIPLAAGGAVGLVNPALGAAVGTGALLGTFGLGTFHSSKDEATKFLTETRPELSFAEIDQLASDKAMKDASFETGTEFVGDLAAVLTFGGSKALTQPLKATLKEMMNPESFLKAYAKSAPFEVGSEMVSAVGQSYAASDIGMNTQGPMESAGEAIVPALFMSLGFGGAIHGYSKLQANSLLSDLNADDVETRAKAARTVANGLYGSTKDAEIANSWLGLAGEKIELGEKIEVDMPLADFGVQKIAEEQTPLTSGKVDDLINGQHTVDDVINERRLNGIGPVVPDGQEATTVDDVLAQQAQDKFNEVPTTTVRRPQGSNSAFAEMLQELNQEPGHDGRIINPPWVKLKTLKAHAEETGEKVYQYVSSTSAKKVLQMVLAGQPLDANQGKILDYLNGVAETRGGVQVEQPVLTVDDVLAEKQASQPGIMDHTHESDQARLNELSAKNAYANRETIVNGVRQPSGQPLTQEEVQEQEDIQDRMAKRATNDAFRMAGLPVEKKADPSVIDAEWSDVAGQEVGLLEAPNSVEELPTLGNVVEQEQTLENTGADSVAPVVPPSSTSQIKTLNRKGRDEKYDTDIASEEIKDGVRFTETDASGTRNEDITVTGTGVYRGTGRNGQVLNKDGYFVSGKDINRNSNSKADSYETAFQPENKDKRAVLELITDIEWAQRTGDVVLAERLEGTLYSITSGAMDITSALDKARTTPASPSSVSNDIEPAPPTAYEQEVPSEQTVGHSAPGKDSSGPTVGGSDNSPDAEAEYPIIEHTTKKGKVLRGTVVKGITKQEAAKIDPFPFAKDGGFFIREKHFGNLPKPTQEVAPVQEVKAENYTEETVQPETNPDTLSPESSVEPDSTQIKSEDKGDNLDLSSQEGIDHYTGVANGLKKGDVITNDMGDSFTVTGFLKNKATGDISSFEGEWDNGKFDVLKMDKMRTLLAPTPFIDRNTGKNKQGVKATISSPQPGESEDANSIADAEDIPDVERVADHVGPEHKVTPAKLAEQKKWLLGDIDKALSDIKTGKTTSESSHEEGSLITTFLRRPGEFNEYKGKVYTFDVPGDGKFKVQGTEKALTLFRKGIDSLKTDMKNPPLPYPKAESRNSNKRTRMDDGTVGTSSVPYEPRANGTLKIEKGQIQGTSNDGKFVGDGRFMVDVGVIPLTLNEKAEKRDMPDHIFGPKARDAFLENSVPATATTVIDHNVRFPEDLVVKVESKDKHSFINVAHLDAVLSKVKGTSLRMDMRTGNVLVVDSNGDMVAIFTPLRDNHNQDGGHFYNNPPSSRPLEKVNDKPELSTANDQTGVKLYDTLTFTKEDLAGITVPVRAVDEEGVVGNGRMDAFEEMERIDEEIRTFNELINCMKNGAK